MIRITSLDKFVPIESRITALQFSSNALYQSSNRTGDCCPCLFAECCDSCSDAYIASSCHRHVLSMLSGSLECKGAGQLNRSNRLQLIDKCLRVSHPTLNHGCRCSHVGLSTSASHYWPMPYDFLQQKNDASIHSRVLHLPIHSTTSRPECQITIP